MVYDREENTIVHSERTPAEPIEDQLGWVFKTSVTFDNAVVRAIDGDAEAMLYALEPNDVWVGRSGLPD